VADLVTWPVSTKRRMSESAGYGYLRRTNYGMAGFFWRAHVSFLGLIHLP